MAMDCGGNLRNVSIFRPGRFGIYPRRSACSNVDSAGENRDAWAKETKSAGVAEPIAEKAVASCCGVAIIGVALANPGGGLMGLGFGRSRCHNLVRVER